jgi:oxygen-dependent protoporphyrinogen oxidase
LGPAPTDEALLRRFIDDVRHFDPRLASAPLADAYVQRNDMALPTFRPGYLRALNDFRKETGQQRLAFAGDYLLNTSVGSAHLTGLQAAQQLDARLRATS